MIVDHFDELTAQGIRVIPLWENSKRPMCKGWTKDWDRNKLRRLLQVYPSANIGILLGEIIDVEGDSERANRSILDLVRDYPHPSYSSQRSIHHLFLSPDPKLRVFSREKMEFRGHGHQSVLPPSEHEGSRYEWIDATFPVPPMPPKLVEFYQKLKKGKWHHNQTRPEHQRIRCSNCRKPIILHKKRLELERETFSLLGTDWECQDCRTLDIRAACRRLKGEKNLPKRLQ